MQSVGTPRFYINDIEWIYGDDTVNLGDHFYTTPVVPKSLVANQSFTIPYDLLNPYVVILGHQNVQDISITSDDSSAVSSVSGAIKMNEDASQPGWSLIELSATPDAIDISGTGGSNPTIGSVVIGSYYDMPVSPNLALDMSREYGESKDDTALNGSTYSNTMWHSQPRWGDLGAWELSSAIPNMMASGRRIWNLSFSYISDRDLFPTVSNLNIYGTDLESSAGELITDHNDFFSQVWHKSSTRNFIFQADKDNYGVDGFAIARFVDNTLDIEQTAVNVYDISLKIEEVW